MRADAATKRVDPNGMLRLDRNDSRRGLGTTLLVLLGLLVLLPIGRASAQAVPPSWGVKTFDFGAKDGIPAVTFVYPIDFLPAT